MANEPLVGEIRRGYEIGKADQRRAYIWKQCVDCGFLNWSTIRGGKQFSVRCSGCANSRRLKGKMGPDSIAWHGGKVHNSEGYVKILMPHSPRADVRGYMFEHIYVWETTHQMPVPNDCVIHHLNGVKNDNRPENLFAMKRGLHVGLAQPYKRKIRELESEIRLLRNALENNQTAFSMGGN